MIHPNTINLCHIIVIETVADPDIFPIRNAKTLQLNTSKLIRTQTEPYNSKVAILLWENMSVFVLQGLTRFEGVSNLRGCLILCVWSDLIAALCIPADHAAPSAGEPSSLPVWAAQCGRSVSLTGAAAAAAPAAWHTHIHADTKYWLYRLVSIVYGCKRNNKQMSKTSH